MTRLTKVRHILPRNAKIKLVLLIVGAIIGAQVETLTLAAIQPFILILTDPSIIYSNRTINFIYTALMFDSTTVFLAFLAVVIALVYAFRGLYVYFFNRIQNLVIAKSRAVLKHALLSKAVSQPYAYHANHNTAELQRSVGRNAERFFGVLSNTMSLMVDGFMSIFILGFLMISSTGMTMVVLLLAAICIVVYFKILKSKINANGEDEARGQVAITKAILQTLGGVKEIKLMHKDAHFANRFKNIVFATVGVKARMQSLRQLPKLFIESLCFSGAFIVVAIAILSGVDLQLLIPQLSMFVLAAFKLLPAISRFVISITLIMRHSRTIDLVYSDLFEQDDEFAYTAPEPTDIVHSQDILVNDITFKYPRSKKALLKNVSFRIPQNQSVAFIGPSGAGKSTLVDIILGVFAPQSGYVAHNGKSVHHNFKSWSKNIGYVPQTIYLLDETILENVAFGIEKDKIDEEKVWRALEQAQLKDYVMGLPEGLLTSVGERGVRISGGQRQRIGIARALYNDPPILVLDEATSALDSKTEKAVMEAVHGLQGSKTVIIVAHRLSTIKRCDIIFKVAKGTVKESSSRAGRRSGDDS